MTKTTPPDVSDWLACRCCNRSYPALNMIRFECSPGDAICVTCAESLYSQSRPIHRRLHPVWPLVTRIRARLTAAGR